MTNERSVGFSRRALACGAAALAAGVLLAGCAAVQGALAPPEVRLAQLTLLDASAARQRFELLLEVENPNPIPFPIEALGLSVRLGGAGVLDGQTTEPFVLPPRGSESVRVEVTSDIVSSVSRLLALAQGAERTLAYELNGRVTPSRRLSGPIPFGTRGDVPLRVPSGR